MSEQREQIKRDDTFGRSPSDGDRFFLASIIESLEDSVVSVDFNAVITSWNKGAERLYGYPAAEVMGQPLSMLTLPEDMAQVLANIESIKRGGQAQVYETERIDKDGRRFQLSMTLSPVRDEAGRIIGVSTVTRDITERRQAEDKLRFLAGLNQALSPLAEPDDIMSTTARMLGEHLRVNRCAYAEVESDQDSFRITGDYTRDTFSIVGAFKMSAFGAEALQLMRLNRPYVVNDAEQDPRTAEHRDAYRQTDIAAVISVPLHKHGRFVAGMAVHQKTPRHWTTEEIGLVQIVVNRCWESIERARTVRNLRHSEERFRALVSQATAGISQVDNTGRFIFVNERFCEVVGYTREELLQLRMQEITVPDVLAENLQLFRRVWEHGIPFVIEKQYIRKDGSRVWVSNNVAAVVGASGRTETVVCVTIDITERIEAEQSLRQIQAENDRQRRLYDTILSNTPDLVYVFDLEHRFTYANDVLLELWGKSWDEAIGKNCLELGYEPWHAAQHDRELNQVKVTKQSIRGVVPFSGTFGRRVYDYIFVPIIGVDGEVEAIAGTTRDITDLKKAEEDLRHSQEMLGFAMSGSRMGAWSRNLASEEVYWSPELEAIFGLPAGAFPGHIAGFYELVYAEDRESLRREIRQAIAERSSYVVEFRYRHADGSIRWMEGRGQAIYSAEGEPTNVYGIGIDITERKREELNAEFLADLGDDFTRASTPEEVVRAVGERLHRFLKTSACAFVEIDEARELATINYEWHHGEVPGLNGVYRLTEFITPEFRHMAVSGEPIAIRNVETDARIAHPRPWRALKIGAHLNVPLIRNGEWKFSLCVYHQSAYGWHESEIDLMRELSSRVWARLERAFAEQEREGILKRELAARLQAEEASRLKDEFLATVSHELRTPLTAILGWTHMLRNGQVGDGAAKALETIERNARTQAQLIDDLLDVSRIVTGKLRLDVRTLDPNVFIDAAIEAVRPAAEAKGVRLQKMTDAGVLAVSGDPVRLQQVVWNLLSNAIKFTPTGGRVQVSLEHIGSQVEIVVRDTGQGIAPEFLPHAFDRFRQADQTTTRFHGGLGLGLAIVRHLVELHGGTVHAESEGEGRGAAFTVRLPLAPVYRPEAPARRASPQTAPALPVYDYPERLDGLRILVVDDEPDTREMLKIGLESCGAEVTAAGSAGEALEALRANAPDLLISDIGMPGQDGYALIAEVRALAAAEGGKVPAVALTAYARMEDRLRALRAGYQMHVTKPVELAELAAVASMLTRGEA